jgi:hypothetical protein
MTVVCKTNPDYEKLCDYLDALIPATSVTATAAVTGNWNSTSTWVGGALPSAGSIVLIPNGITVTVDGTVVNSILAILNQGVLNFSPTATTSLTVDTIVSGTDNNPTTLPWGEIRIGTKATPIASNHTCTITFSNTGTLAAIWPNDWQQLARGLISMGKLTIYGSYIQPWVALGSSITAGDGTVTLSAPPTNWSAGDVLFLPGTNTANQDESVTVTSISGSVVTLTGTCTYSHTLPTYATLPVINTRRNVLITGTASTTRGGHVMQCHNNDCVIANAAFVNLGRTDKSVHLNNGTFDQNTGIGTPGTNQVGRYALHLHRCMWINVTDNDPMIPVLNCYQTNSPGWGFDNHSSNVNFDSNCCVNNFGACIVNEAGNEIGLYNNNVAARAVGVANGAFLEGSRLNDFGFGGDGFWLQSPGCSMSNNIAFNCQTGYFWYNIGLNEGGTLGVCQFWTAYTRYPQDFPGVPLLDPEAVSMPLFYKNQAAWCSGNSATISYHQNLGVPIPRPYTVIDTLIADLAPTNLNMNGDSSRITFQNCTCKGDNSTGSVNMRAGAYADGIKLLNMHMENCKTCVMLPGETVNLVQGGYYDAPTAFLIPRQSGNRYSNRFLQFTGTITFGGTVTTQYNLNTTGVFSAYGFALSYGVRSFFPPDNILYPDGRQLYWPEQVAAAVPFASGIGLPVGPTGIPPQLIGMTTQQIWNSYGIAVGGSVAPPGAVPIPGTDGLAGPPTPINVWFQQMSVDSANVNQPYTIQYAVVTNGSQGPIVTDPTPVTLSVGWNLIKRTINGQATTFMVWGIQPNPGQLASVTTLAASSSQIVYGQGVTLTATVIPASGAGIPTGVVTFFDGQTVLGTGNLVNGSVAITTGALALGAHTLSAAYGGDGTYATSTGTTSLSVVQDSSITTLTSSGNPAVSGQLVILTAGVTAGPPGAGNPTGTVAFKDGTTNLATAVMGGGQAVYATSGLSPGTHNITSSYSGDVNFTPSQATLTQTVSQGGTTFVNLIVNVNPSNFGQTITFAITVIPTHPSTLVPTGTVTMIDGVAVLGVLTIDSRGQALFAIGTLSVGTHNITAAYGGDQFFTPSVSPVLKQQVIQPKTPLPT